MSSIVAPEAGETVVFGAEGFARVEGIEEKEVLGRPSTFLHLFVIDSSMRVSVPLERAHERGLRSIASPDEADAVLESFAQKRWTSIPWNRDGRLVKERYAEGNLDAVVDVIGSLVETMHTKKLNDAQRNLYDRARRGIVNEIAVAYGIENEAASARLDEALAEHMPV